MNALDHAVRNALTPAYPVVEKFEPIGLPGKDPGQGSRHGRHRSGADSDHRWLAGVDHGQRRSEHRGASWEALSDAYLYGLIHADDPVVPKQSDLPPLTLPV